jgi:hypothetical protein
MKNIRGHDMSRHMDTTVDEEMMPEDKARDGFAPGRPTRPQDRATAGERAQAAMALYKTYIAGYRAWALRHRRPTP